MKKQNKIIILSMVLALAIVSLLGFASAAVAFITPVAGANISTTTFLANCSYVNGTDITDPTAPGSGNTSFFFGTTLMATLTGPACSVNACWATLNTGDIATDSTGTLKCSLGNSTDKWFANATAVITIDRTAPTATITLDDVQISQGRQEIITWTSADALSGLSTSLLTITSPDTTRCPTITETTSSGSVTLVDQQTICTGYYTVAFTQADLAGNSVTATPVQFRVTMLDGKFIGEQGIESISKKSDNTNTIVIVAVIIILALLYFKSKK